MKPCKVSAFSEFICSAFQIQGYLAQNKSWNASKIASEVRKGLKIDDVAWMVHFEWRKSLESKYVKKMKSLL